MHHASQEAQQVLTTASEAIQNCEDRLVRVEQLVSGVVDQQAETDVGMRSGLEALQSEMPILQEILSRLPKLPHRKPPPQEKTTDACPPSSSSQAPMSQPATPPVSLEPQGLPPQPAPTVIPVQMEQNQGASSTQGIQLRLAEHVGAMTPAQQAPQLIIGGDNRQPNFLIAPLPAQQASGSDILRAMLR